MRLPFVKVLCRWGNPLLIPMPIGGSTEHSVRLGMAVLGWCARGHECDAVIKGIGAGDPPEVGRKETVRYQREDMAKPDSRKQCRA